MTVDIRKIPQEYAHLCCPSCKGPLVTGDTVFVATSVDRAKFLDRDHPIACSGPCARSLAEAILLEFPEAK